MHTRVITTSTPDGFPVYLMPELDFSKLIRREPLPTKGAVRAPVRDIEPIGDQLTYTGSRK
jgi:hypothetical protein